MANVGGLPYTSNSVDRGRFAWGVLSVSELHHAFGKTIEPPDDVETNPCARELVAFLVTALFALAIGALVLWGRGPAAEGDEGARLDAAVCPADPFPLRLDQVARQEARDAAEAAGAPSDAVARTLVDAWKAANRLEAAAGDGGSLAARNTELAGQMAAYVADAGFEPWRLLGLVQVEALLAVVARLEARGADEGLDLPRFALRHPADPDVISFQEQAGDLLSYAAGSDLFAQDPDDTAGEARRRFLLRVLVKVRWLLWVRDVRPMETGLSRFEYQRFLLWRGARQALARPDETMRLIDELRRLSPDAHWAWGFGCRALAGGRPQLARALFLAELAVHGDHGPSRNAIALIDGK